mmetsp:Transcript_12309/g.31076  ORF Transcript_12309/g.31076 Transcript_12309/m.31076 type:complete len:876 (-) Transcript_12309:152-2779(-)
MGLLLPLPTSVVLTSQDKVTQKWEWMNSNSMSMAVEEKKERKPRLDSNSFLICSKRKRKIQSTSTSKRIRGLWDTTDILSSHFILCVMWFAFAVHLICDNNIFSLPPVDARPHHSSQLCTAIITIPKLHSTTVGLQNFGKSLREDVDSSYSYLTILPGWLNGLCEMEGFKHEVLYFPPGDIAVLVDMNQGGCDFLTRASNALDLQKKSTEFLKFVIFYSSDKPSTSLPELSLDATMPPTFQPSERHTDFPAYYPPSTWGPSTTFPPTTMYPSGEPSLSTSPSVSTLPTGEPSMSMEPSASESPITSSSPTEYPTTQYTSTQTTQYISSQYPTSQQPSQKTTTQFPTKSGVSMEPSEMPEAYPTTQAPTELGGASETSEVEEDTFIIRSLSSAYDSLVLNQRARQKQELEDNDSMVFLSMSQFDAYSINVGIDNHLENSSDKSPEFSIEGNQNWDMKMFLNPTKSSGESPSCYSSPTFAPIRQYDPTPFPVRYVPNNTRQPSKSYQDRTPFTIFKFVLFGLLIASPCLRLIHQWWAGGGRIRFRRSEDGDSNRVVGLQYIPPMDNWYGGPLETNEAPRPPDRLTVQQIMSLPEIRYTKPIHHDDKINETKTIEESDESLENSSNHLYNEADDIDDDNQGDGSTEIIGIPGETSASTGGEEMERDASIVSEASFENEPSVRLELPTSPPRVTSMSVSQTTNPLSPRAIVQTEEVPPDEERPEEQEDPDPQGLQRPTLVSPPPTPLPRLLPTSPTSLSPLVQRTSQPVSPPRPVSPLPQEQCLRESEIAPLSFRTQRRLQSFTTTTCTTCSICIDEFEVGETIRLLPRCGHAFHTDCILPWLQDRQGCCPLCKTEVLDRASEENTNNNERRAERRSSF